MPNQHGGTLGASGGLDPTGVFDWPRLAPHSELSGRAEVKARDEPPFHNSVFSSCFPSGGIRFGLVFSLFLLRISRLFSDVKKILLYSQNDKNLDGFKELSHALQLLQDSRSGRKSLPLTSQRV